MATNIKPIKIAVADFETCFSNVEDKYRVWSWGFSYIKSNKVTMDTDIESFIELITSLKDTTILYFHNLKFDFSYIIDYLLRNGWEQILKGTRKKKQFTCFSSQGNIYFVKIGKVTILDSFKMLLGSLDSLGKGYGCKEVKQVGKIDYDKVREKGHIMTDEEVIYLRADILLLAELIEKNIEIDRKFTSSKTIASHCYKEWLETTKLTKKQLSISYEIDTALRPAYRGGFVYVNPLHKNKIIDNVNTIDVNSLYPYVMLNDMLPYGQPIIYNHMVKFRPFKRYVLDVTFTAKLKPNHVPTFQESKGFRGNSEYCIETGTDFNTVFCDYDYALLLTNYDIKSLKVNKVYEFNAKRGLFNVFLNKYVEQKIEATKTGNKPLRMQAKLKMNSLSGKFAQRPDSTQDLYYIDELTDVIKAKKVETDVNMKYLPISMFITAGGRRILHDAIKKVGYKNFIYCDTDSIHHINNINSNYKSLGITVDSSVLGAWDLEKENVQGKYLHAKCYFEDGKPTVAGLSKDTKININDFKHGMEVSVLKSKRKKGGIALNRTTFEIK